ncbi:aminoacyl-tRNA hydrolase [Alloalcanivorax xenomutans]|uniref:aminoacyl-tRNA hydrolase n=1 Tax=Alloalcanivorax xenomutans TaxID=1094342 RepID=UPI00292DE440|nr:aminoacyl-tRNA hydrolase [Alloalcanivorax xenomutans]WOA30671.1 aminoacyl-tRNA hydrolase [Alloalcanivorax xenomutans]
MAPVRLIVGLGNPGQEYEQTRHNAGVWYVDALARAHGVHLNEEKKYFGVTGTFTFEGETIRLLVPTTFMNRSGQSTSALANFFKIPTEEILVAHDELDLPPGTARFKQGGGHGGHNGLKDIISRHGNNRNFYRLRIGIGHPGSAQLVTPHVLNKPSTADRTLIEHAIDEAVRYTPDLLRGDLNSAMNHLNGFRA